MKNFKKKMKLASLFTALIFLFELFSPVFYGMIQAELYMSVSGKIIDRETRQGIKNASIIIFQIENGRPVQSRGVLANKDGKYFLEILPPGEYQISVFPPKDGRYAFDATQTKIVNIVRGKNVTNVDFQLGQNEHISGKIYDADGIAGIKKAIVFAISKNSVGTAFTDDAGQYAIKSLKQGSYAVIVIPNGYAVEIRENIIVPSSIINQSLNISLNAAKTTCVSGRVVSSVNGVTIKDALVTIATERSQGLSFTDSNGQYKICGLEAASYKVSAGANRYEIRAKENVQIVDNQEITENFDLAPIPTKSGYKSEQKTTRLGLNTAKHFFGIFGPSYAYAQGGGGCSWTDKSCLDVCFETLYGPGGAGGWAGIWNQIKNIGLNCILGIDPNNLFSANTLFAVFDLALCGWDPNPLPSSAGFVLMLVAFLGTGPILGSIISAGIATYCAATTINAYFVCPYMNALACVLECG